jgi:hypothetical protein
MFVWILVPGSKDGTQPQFCMDKVPYIRSQLVSRPVKPHPAKVSIILHPGQASYVQHTFYGISTKYLSRHQSQLNLELPWPPVYYDRVQDTKYATGSTELDDLNQMSRALIPRAHPSTSLRLSSIQAHRHRYLPLYGKRYDMDLEGVSLIASPLGSGDAT